MVETIRKTAPSAIILAAVFALLILIGGRSVRAQDEDGPTVEPKRRPPLLVDLIPNKTIAEVGGRFELVVRLLNTSSTSTFDLALPKFSGDSVYFEVLFTPPDIPADDGAENGDSDGAENGDSEDADTGEDTGDGETSGDADDNGGTAEGEPGATEEATGEPVEERSVGKRFERKQETTAKDEGGRMRLTVVQKDPANKGSGFRKEELPSIELKPRQSLTIKYYFETPHVGTYEVFAVYAGAVEHWTDENGSKQVEKYTAAPDHIESEPVTLTVTEAEGGFDQLVAKVETTLGDFVFAFETAEALNHVRNFIEAVTDLKYYSQPTYIYYLDKRRGFFRAGATGSQGSGGLDFRVPAEFGELKHKAGTVFAVRSDESKTDKTQNEDVLFGICLDEMPKYDEPDGKDRHTPFGMIVRGMDVVEAIGDLPIRSETEKYLKDIEDLDAKIDDIHRRYLAGDLDKSGRDSQLDQLKTAKETLVKRRCEIPNSGSREKPGPETVDARILEITIIPAHIDGDTVILKE